MGGSQASAPTSLSSLTRSVAIGVSTELFKGFRNVFIGDDAARDAVDDSDGVVIGYNAALMGAADKSVVLGSSAACKASAGGSVVIGANAALAAETVSRCVLVGRYVASTTNSVTQSILIGDTLAVSTPACNSVTAIGTSLAIGGSNAGLSQSL